MVPSKIAGGSEAEVRLGGRASMLQKGEAEANKQITRDEANPKNLGLLRHA